MQFFVPNTTSPRQAEEVYASVRRFLADNGWPTADERYESLSFQHDGKTYVLNVGQRHYELPEPVMLILRAEGAQNYYVCTPNRGTVRGAPYLIGDEAQAKIAVAFSAA
ncbi:MULTISPECIES: hypothetical protein [Phenylobacterium]|uniref:Uncharacterized protein n=1 Tax=Phenylobacterium koreense TaxID=266125 RepID=A0ABV2EF71_9CAUL